MDGSWSPKPSREITAYTIIVLANLVFLPFVSESAAQIESAISSGRLFMTTNEQIPTVEYLWIAKTMYSPITVSETYILAESGIIYPKYHLSSSLKDVIGIPRERLFK